MLAVIEYDLEMEPRDGVVRREAWLGVAILDLFQVTPRDRLSCPPVALRRPIGDLGVVFRLVMITNKIAAIVARLAQEPGKDA